jgi:SapC protein
VVNLVVLDSQTHRQVCIASTRAVGYARNAVSVVTREFPRLLAHYPIFFTKSADTGQFEPAAILGFGREENLFVDDGRWDALYVPLQIQRQPFSLIPKAAVAEGQPGTLEVALDQDSPYIATGEGERLFSEDGQATRFLQNITSVLAALVKGSTETYAFTRRLAELDLIEPVQIKIEFVDGSDTQLQGLYWISGAHLKALPAAQLAELRDSEYLEWMYFQMASVAHVSALVARKNQLISGMRAAPAQGVDRGAS